MKIFLDTSSLLKLYHQENDTDDLINLLSKDVKAIYLSEIAKVEFSSAIRKKVRTKELNAEKALEKIDYFRSDFTKYLWLKLDEDIIEKARQFLNIYGTDGLRSLDSLQLASAANIRKDADLFVSSDKILNNIFEKEGLKVYHRKKGGKG